MKTCDESRAPSDEFCREMARESTKGQKSVREATKLGCQSHLVLITFDEILNVNPFAQPSSFSEMSHACPASSSRRTTTQTSPPVTVSSLLAHSRPLRDPHSARASRLRRVPRTSSVHSPTKSASTATSSASFRVCRQRSPTEHVLKNIERLKNGIIKEQS